MSNEETGVDGPKETMHRDDTLWDRYPSVFNRKNLVRASIAAAAVTFGLICLEAYRIENYLAMRKDVSEQRNDEQYERDRQLGCLVVEGRSSDDPAVAAVRNRYNCPPYRGSSKESSSGRSRTSPTTSANPRPTSATVAGGPTFIVPTEGSNQGGQSAPPSAPVTVVRTQDGRTVTQFVPSTVTRAPSASAGPKPQYSPNPLLCYPLGLPVTLGCPSR